MGGAPGALAATPGESLSPGSDSHLCPPIPKRLQEEQRQRERDWDRQMVQRARDSMLVQRQLQREQREARRALDYSNLSLATEHQLR